MQFRIFPRGERELFEDDDIAVRAFHGGRLSLDTTGTLFFAVISGQLRVDGYLMRPGMYGCLPRFGEFAGDDCRVMVVDAKRFTGILALGGPLERTGRLRYIDGCTDTGVLQPLRLGDPCLNVLYFPETTLQTAHTHPSHRIGAIFDGEGFCLTDTGATPMRQGDIFIIPTDALHWFRTDESAMRIMVFHPDSEFGPTDELHQMREATIIPAVA